MTTPDGIASFQGEYRFLSNFYPCSVVLDGVDYPSVEHAFQAAKARIDDVLVHFDPHLGPLTKPVRMVIRSASTPGQAKRLGRKIKLRPGWEDMRLEVMEGLVRQKFTNDWCLAERLLKTGDAELIEGNWWGDTFWGVCQGKGENNLGKILMRVREEVRNLT